MTRTEHLLTILAEECAEVAQRASKALRFGLTDAEPGQPLNNAERILEEWCHLVAALEMLYEAGSLPAPWPSRVHWPAVDAKKAKVERHLQLSVERGTLAAKAPQLEPAASVKIIDCNLMDRIRG